MGDYFSPENEPLGDLGEFEVGDKYIVLSLTSVVFHVCVCVCMYREWQLEGKGFNVQPLIAVVCLCKLIQTLFGAILYDASHYCVNTVLYYIGCAGRWIAIATRIHHYTWQFVVTSTQCWFYCDTMPRGAVCLTL